MGLYDRVLIKENHIAAAGSLTGAIEAARRSAPELTVEVEVESPAELEEALDAKPDIIMLDDFSLAALQAAVKLNQARGRPVTLEAAGSVSLETVRAIDRKSTRLNSSHSQISYAVFCLKKKKNSIITSTSVKSTKSV